MVDSRVQTRTWDMTHLGVMTHGYPDGGYAVKRHLWHVTDCTPLCTCTPPRVCDTGVALFGGYPEGPHRGPQGGSPDDQSEGLQIRRIGVPDGLGGTEVHIHDMDTPSHYMSSSTTRRVPQDCP